MCAVVLSEKLTATWREKTPTSTKKARIVAAWRLSVATDGFVVGRFLVLASFQDSGLANERV